MARLTDTIVDGYLQVAGDSSTLTSNNNTLNSDTSNSYTVNVTNINTVDLCASGALTAKTATLTATSGSPMIVYSETQVPHLNASLLQGHTIGGANELFLLDSEGMIPTYSNVDKVGTGKGPTDNYTNRVQHEAYNVKNSDDTETCYYGIVRKATEKEAKEGTVDDCFISPTQLKLVIREGSLLQNATVDILGCVTLATTTDVTNCSATRNNYPVVVTPATLAKAQKNGVATLDSDGFVPNTQLRRASNDIYGIAETATDNETLDGTNKFKIVTPYELAYYAKNRIVIYQYNLSIGTGWATSSDGSYYTYTFSGLTHVNTGVNVQLLPATNITANQLRALQYANIQDASQTNTGSITIKAFGMKPTVSIPIRLMVGGTVVNA